VLFWRIQPALQRYTAHYLSVWGASGFRGQRGAWTPIRYRFAQTCPGYHIQT